MAEDSAAVEIAAHSVIQLFNSLDPSPFPERDLDDEVEAYIVSWAKELSPSGSFRIVIHLPRAEVIKAEEQFISHRAKGKDGVSKAGLGLISLAGATPPMYRETNALIPDLT